MRRCVIAALVLLPGCCGDGDPIWSPFEPIYLGGATTSVDLSGHITDDRGVPEISASPAGGELIVEVDGSELLITPQPGWRGSSSVILVAEDACGNRSSTELEVHGGEAPTPGGGPGACSTILTYAGPESLDGVAVAGAFNGWSAESHPMAFEDGAWSIALELEPGAYPYKLVELGGASGDEGWLCDPEARFIQCEEGYKEPWEIGLTHDCVPGGTSCNSLLVVEPCAPPRLQARIVEIDRGAGSVHVEIDAVPGSGGEVVDAVATLDDQPIEGWTGAGFVVSAGGLATGRHTLRFSVTDAGGNTSDEVYIPLWIDDWSWEDGVLYFAFLDRVHNGEAGNDGSEGATAVGGAYEGGDLQGLLELIPYLDDLGVDILWLSNLQDNAEGAWDGQCGLTFSGYHAYWPDAARSIEEHFGDEADLEAVVEAAHARGMRVIMDWVANHVHQDHPYAVEHPEWFNDFEHCESVVDGQLGFDRIPERCWFAPYLPDIDYAQPEALVTMVDDAMWWAKTYELDGFRVDAVKHMSHAVVYNLAGAVDAQLEHTDAGGDEHFWTLGETFDSYDRINAYIGERGLSGQFDFPLYYSIRDAFIYGNGTLPDVLASYDTSRAAYGDALMSNFLGNHDVLRFITDAETGYLGACDGAQIRVAPPSSNPWAYQRLALAFTFLFTVPGTPLVYYGDELGLSGNPDPDNRQPLWWRTGDLSGVSSVAELSARVDPLASDMLWHVRALAHARSEHVALRRGERIEWWAEPDLVAYALGAEGDHALVILNRGGSDRQLTNGLSFAGLPGGVYEDVLTQATFTSARDQITIDVGANRSRVLVWRSP